MRFGAPARPATHRLRCLLGLRILAFTLALLLLAGAGERGARQHRLPVRGLSVAQSGQVADASGWQATELSLPKAWQVTRGSPSVVVAIVDTGVQADHPALAGHVLEGWNLVSGTGDSSDDNGHGTALAGIVLSVCPQCSILPVKVLGSDMTGSWSTVAAGITWAADHGAKVINLSLGSPGALDAVGTAVAQALAKGVIVVAAAGNDGRNERFYPALYPGIVSVSGIDANDARYAWSNFGSWVTVAAPGCADAPWIGGGYKWDFCGTSTAAPFVAGVAGLARSADPSLTPAQFAGAFASASDPLPDGSTSANGGADAARLLATLPASVTRPVVTVQPAIRGTATVGRRLVSLVGVWRGAPSYALQWQRSFDGSHWHVVGTGSSYLLRASDRAARLRIVVTASNAAGATTVVSAVTAQVRKA